MGKKTESRKHGMRTPRPETEEKYREAIELYRTTGLTVREICARTGVPFTAFRSFLHSCHRELMFARYGMEVAPEEAAATRLRKRSGQTAASRAKYGEAIRACDDIAYIEYNVSQIACSTWTPSVWAASCGTTIPKSSSGASGNATGWA